MTDSVKGALLTMFGGMCWGVSGCVGQYLFTRQGMDSTWLVPIRLFLAGVILCIYYGVRNWRQLVNPWRSWRNARRRAFCAGMPGQIPPRSKPLRLVSAATATRPKYMAAPPLAKSAGCWPRPKAMPPPQMTAAFWSRWQSWPQKSAPRARFPAVFKPYFSIGSAMYQAIVFAVY